MRGKGISLVSGLDFHMESDNGGCKMEAKMVRKHQLTVFERIEANSNNSSLNNDWLSPNFNELNLEKDKWT